jgi:hypothetical protein
MDSAVQQREILLKALKELVLAVDSAKWPAPYNALLVEALHHAAAPAVAAPVTDGNAESRASDILGR